MADFQRVRLALLLACALSLVGCLGVDKANLASQVDSSRANATDARPIDGGTPASAGNASAGAVPHKHDYWKGKERVTVLQDDITLSPTNATSFLPLFDQRPALGAAFLALPDGQIVYEGTGRLEFTATWSDPTITGLVLRYKSTGNPDYSQPEPLASGRALAIDVAPSMTDEPHAKSSRWGFFLEADGTGGAGLADGKVSVRADIVKMRDIETFPAHPDLFAGAASVRVFDKDVEIKSESSVDNAKGFFTHSQTPPGFAPEKPVPPEATTLLVRIDVKSATSNMPAEDTSRLRLQYRTAESAVHYEAANLSMQQGKTYVFKIESTPQKGDGYYAKTSAWRFDPFLKDNVQGNEVDCDFGDCFDWDVEAHLTIIALKADADPATVLAT